MKNIIIALLCLVFLAGCQQQNIKPANIVGTWNLTRITTKVFQANELVFQADSILSNSNVFTFNGEGKGSLKNNANFIGLYNYTYDETLSGSFSYSVSDSKLGMRFLAQDRHITKSIVFLDSNQLIMHTEESVDEDGRCDANGAYTYVIDEYLFK